MTTIHILLLRAVAAGLLCCGALGVAHAQGTPVPSASGASAARAAASTASGPVRQAIKQRVEAMTPEQKQKLKDHKPAGTP